MTKWLWKRWLHIYLTTSEKVKHSRYKLDKRIKAEFSPHKYVYLIALF